MANKTETTQPPANDQADLVKALETQLAAKDEQLNKANEVLAQQNELLASKDQELADKDELLRQAEDLIAEQQAALDEADSPAGNGPKVLTYDGQKYEVRAPKFQLGNKEYSADDLAGDKELVKKLVDRKSGVLRPVK